MRWTDMSEKEMIKAWAAEDGTVEFADRYLPKIDRESESYWCAYDSDGDIKEYAFETVPELKELLKQELSEEFYGDLILPLTVAAFKEKQIIRESAEESGDEEGVQGNQDGFTIPEFVYVF